MCSTLSLGSLTEFLEARDSAFSSRPLAKARQGESCDLG